MNIKDSLKQNWFICTLVLMLIVQRKRGHDMMRKIENYTRNNI